MGNGAREKEAKEAHLGVLENAEVKGKPKAKYRSKEEQEPKERVEMSAVSSSSPLLRLPRNGQRGHGNGRRKKRV